MSNKSLETINIKSDINTSTQTQGQKCTCCSSWCQIIAVETTETTGCRVSTDPITIWIMGFRFLFWQGLSISHSCLRVFTHWCTVCYKHWIIEGLEQLTFLRKQIHSSCLFATWSCTTGLFKKKEEKKGGRADRCKAFPPRTRQSILGRKGGVGRQWARPILFYLHRWMKF